MRRGPVELPAGPESPSAAPRRLIDATAEAGESAQTATNRPATEHARMGMCGKADDSEKRHA